MTTAIKRRRGTTAQHATFTGLEGELTIDTTKDTVVVHDGATAGGFPLAKESQVTSNVAITGGTISGITDLAVADGGTGASTAGDARTNLGVTATGADTTYAYRANNLSDLASASTARSNLGLGTIATQAASSVTLTGGSINGTTVGASTPSTGSFTSLTDSGNLTFTGTGNRILGDFSNSTTASRVFFQSSTTNGNTLVSAMPNGTGTVSQFIAYNSSDQTNFSYFLMGTANGGTEARLNSAQGGTGTYLPITMYTGGSERLRIDTSGNVGIGTSSPAVRLNVAASNDTPTIIQTTNANNYLQLTNLTNSVLLGAIGANFNFTVNGSERMRIDSSGNLLVGTTSADIFSANNGFAFLPNQSTAGGAALGIGHATGTSSGYSYIVFNYAGGAIGSISQNGTTAVAYNTSSDYRLKENIAPMQNALNVVQQLKPVTYNWKADGSSGQGFIAHELQAVVPDCVTGEKDAVDAEGKPVYQGIDTSFLVATLTKAIQELKAELDVVKAELNTLKGN